MKITPNFSSEEFDCKDGTPYPKDKINSCLLPLCQQLEVIREAFKGKPIKILSGYRTPEHNKKVGGVKNSQHVQGIAADIVIEDISTSVLAKKIRELISLGKIRQGGVGEYSTFVHYDIRGVAARWSGK